MKTDKPDFEKIKFYCGEVIKLTPCNPKTHFRMAQALFNLGDYNGALESCQKSLENQSQQGIISGIIKMNTVKHLIATVCIHLCLFVCIHINLIDSKVLSLKTNCLAQLAKQTSQEKVMYGKMLGLKMHKKCWSMFIRKTD